MFNSNQGLDLSQDLDFKHVKVDGTVEQPEEVATEPETETEVENSNESTEIGETNTMPENNQPEEVVEEVVTPEVTIGDSDVLAYLRDQGIEVNSFEDLKKPVETAPQPNPLDSNPYLKELLEWQQRTGRPIEDWAKYQQNYENLSDLDIAREMIKIEYPDLTPEEVEFELKGFEPLEEDFDDDVKRKSIALKKYASKGRETLNSLKSSFNTPVPANYSPEVQADLELARQVRENAAAQENYNKEYGQGLIEASKSVGNFSLSLAEGEVIDFGISDNDRKTLPEFIDSMPHWKNEDGTMNFKNIVSDAIKIKHFDKMIQEAYQQGLSKGQLLTTKEMNNSTLGEPEAGATATPRENKIKFDSTLGDILNQGKIKLKF